MAESKWYKEGLLFQCTGCGKCCTGAPGYVWLTQEDIDRLSKHLALSEEAFLKKYCLFSKGRYSLRDLPPHYDCIFLKNGKACTVYEARPKQCRKFPWWKENLRSKQDWENAAKYCEGINHPDGTIYSQEEIDHFSPNEYPP